MVVQRGELYLSTTSGCDVIDVTEEVTRFVGSSGVDEGLCLVYVPGSTAAVTTIEYEPGVVQDLVDTLERLVPSDRPYRHDARWGDGNGYSHVRASLMGPSLSIPVARGEPVLGTWQQIVVVDMDNEPRRREVWVQVIGE